MPRIGLKAKLLLVTLSLAAIPLVGIGYVREMEALLVEQQEANLLAAARAIATALNDRPALLRLKPPDPVLRREKEEAITAILGGGAAATAGAPTASPAPSQATGQTAAQTAAQIIATEASAAPRAVGEEVEAIVASLDRKGTRVWMIDKRFQLLALAGTLKNDQGIRPETLGTGGFWLNGREEPWWERFSGLCHCRNDALRRQRHVAHAHTDRVEYRVADCRRHRAVRRFPRAYRSLIRP